MQDASAMPVTDRNGNALEWSCVSAQVITPKSCRCCAVTFSGGPNRIRAHVLGIRGGGVVACTLINGDPRIQNEFQEIKAELKRRQAIADVAARSREQAREDEPNLAASTTTARSQLGGSSSAPIDLAQRSLPETFAAQTNAIPSDLEVNLAWSKALVGAGIPLSVVEHSLFKAAVTETAKSGSRFLKLNSETKQLESKLATRQAFSSNLLDQTDASVMQQVRALKEPMAKETGLSVMSDGMANIVSKPLLNVICSNPAGQFFVRVIDASGKDKSKEYIAEQANLMIEDEGAENVVVLIMDGACRSAFPLINAKYPHVICLICSAHAIDLLLEDFAKENTQGPVVAGHERFAFDTSFTRETLKANREMVKFITNHEKTLSIYRKLVDDLPRAQRPAGGTELLKPGETRFATEFIASERVYKCRSLLEQTVVSPEFTTWLSKQSKDSVKKAGAAVKQTVLDSTHWEKTGAIVGATCPLYSLLRFCDGERAPPCQPRTRMSLTTAPARSARSRRLAQATSRFSPSSTCGCSRRTRPSPRRRSSTYPMTCAPRCTSCSWRDGDMHTTLPWWRRLSSIPSSGSENGRQSRTATSHLRCSSSRTS